LRGETFDLRLFCFADCATVEERPFQGRVRRRARMRALAPVVVFLCSSEDGSRGLSPQLQKTLDAALEAPLFHGAACVRGGFHQRRFSTVLLTFVGIAESIIPLHRVEMTSYFIPILRLLFSSGDEHHNRFAPHNVTIPDMDWQRTFFITAVTWGRMPIFRVEDRARLLIDVLFDYRGQGKFLLHEFVVMPDHFHALLTPAAEIAMERACNSLRADIRIDCGRWRISRYGRRALRIIGFAMRRIIRGIANTSA